MGYLLCRNEELLSLNCLIVEKIFVTMVLMRLFPLFPHPLVDSLLPSCRSIRRIKRQMVDIVAPIIHERRQMPVVSGQMIEKSDDVLQ